MGEKDRIASDILSWFELLYSARASPSPSTLGFVLTPTLVSIQWQDLAALKLTEACLSSVRIVQWSLVILRDKRASIGSIEARSCH